MTFEQNYSRGVALCESMGMWMATIETVEENDFIYQYYRSINPGCWYIGFNDIGTEGLFIWVHPSTTEYTNWNFLEPDGHDELEDCTSMYGDDYDYNGKWKDNSCFSCGALCEGPMIFYSPTISPGK